MNKINPELIIKIITIFKPQIDKWLVKAFVGTGLSLIVSGLTGFSWYVALLLNIIKVESKKLLGTEYGFGVIEWLSVIIGAALLIIGLIIYYLNKRYTIPDEDLSMTINSFDTPDPLFSAEITYTNEGTCNVFISDIHLVCSQSPLELSSGSHYQNSRIIYPQARENIIIESKKYVSMKYVFGENKEEFKTIIRNFNGQTFKMQLILTVSSVKSGSYKYIVFLANNVMLSPKLDVFACNNWVNAPLNIPLLPFETCVKNIDDKFKIN